MACYTDKVFNRTSKVLLISDIPDLIWDGAPGQERENELRPTTRQRPTTTRDFEPENERGAAAGREEADAAPRVWVETERENSPFPTGRRGEGRKAEAVIRDNNEGRGEGIV